MRPHARLTGRLATAAIVLAGGPGCRPSARQPSLAPVASVTIAPATTATATTARDETDEAPESACTSVLMSLASLVSRSPCGVTGAIGLRWGERATRAGARIGVTCPEWRPSFVSSDFEQCESVAPTVMAYGARAHVTLVRREQRLAAVMVRFDRTRWADIRAAARDELSLSGESATSEAPYTVFSNDSLVRVEPDRGGGGVSVVVTDPAFGKAYASYLLGQGLGGLFLVH